ncbi:MAG: hypothetical protein VYA80_03235 [Pseudomonadota bacterium]|nr:hypothetical protein [Pseudomonadota bacterium]
MNEASQNDIPEFAKDGLYREDSFTDRQIGSIRQLTPVNISGDADSSRNTIFMGSTQVMTAAGPMPLNFDIEAENLQEAQEKFGAAAQVAVEDMTTKLEEMRREQASSIVLPGEGGAPGAGGSGILGG